jgi:hypothetical protein
MTTETFEIQILVDNQWTNDASYLGHGCKQSLNKFDGLDTAQSAIESLIAVGFDGSKLRVTSP